MDRREFLRTAALAGTAAALDGCRCPFCGRAERVPYGRTIGDRLWMWGHHRDSFKALKGRKEGYNLPFDTRIDMAAACREMDIPGCFVVRWTNNPTKAELPEYMRQFARTKRVGFSITDSAVEDFGGKKEMSGADMEVQLAATSRLLSQKAIDGVIFHCTPLVDMNLDAVNVSRAWIRENASKEWGS